MAFSTSIDYSARISSHLALDHQHRHPKQRLGELHIQDDDTLDDNVFDSGMLSPASAGERRDSLANSSSTAIFSPQSSSWEDFQAPSLDRSHSLSGNPFFDQGNSNPFTRPQVANFGNQSGWPLVDRTLDSRTPQAHDAFSSGELDASQHVYLNNGDVSSAHVHGGLSVSRNVQPGSIFPPSTQGIDTPLSDSSERWNAINGSDRDPRPIPKRMRQHSPPRATTPGFLRRDGIRKKNARFEIPAERNLHTIDQMIAEATNEDEIKELKQQKRLLRNRQAALDSRQRKKKHTEELEEEKKSWNERYTMLETELEDLRISTDQHAAERVQWQERFYQQQQQIESLVYEKEDLVAKHTLETGELRKKLNFLVEKLEAKSSAYHVSATPGSTDFADFGLDLGGLAMDTDEWNNYMLADSSYTGDQDKAHQQGHHPHQHDDSMAVAVRKPHTLTSEVEKPVASGLLFMLLLCGAFVASRSSDSQAPPIPRMPEDIRAASATVLDNIFKDAGVAASGPSSGIQHANKHVPTRVHSLEPGPSGSSGSWRPNHRHTLTGGEFASLSQVSGLSSGLGINVNPSAMDRLHQSLMMPSKEQEAEQLFSMTPAQYNSLTNPDFTRSAYVDPNHPDTPAMSDADGPSVSGRKSLAQTLQRMRDDSAGDSAAEVYTRSLLWDRVPSDIVRDFKRMVEESNKLSGGQQSVKDET